MAAADARLEAIDKEVSEIGEDQGRLRDNIKALTATAEARQLIRVTLPRPTRKRRVWSN